MKDRDVRDLFREQGPETFLSDEAARALLPPAEVLFASFEAEPAREVKIEAPRRHPVRHKVLVVTAVALALALLVAAVWALIETRSPKSPLRVGCFQALDAYAPSFIAHVAPGQSPEQACAGGWERQWGTAPPASLVACIVQPDETGVFPNPEGLSQEDACGKVGGALPAEGALYGGLTADEVRALRDDIEARFEAVSDRPGCAGERDLAEQVRAALDAAGATDWSIEDLTSSTQAWVFPDGVHAVVPVPVTADGQTCATYGVDVPHAGVVLNNSWPEIPKEPSSARRSSSSHSG